MSPPADHESPPSQRIGLAQFLAILLIFAVGADTVYRWTNGIWPFTQTATTDDTVVSANGSLNSKDKILQSGAGEGPSAQAGKKEVYDRIPDNASSDRETTDLAAEQTPPESAHTGKKVIYDRIQE